jgi:hypothetical protein
MPCTNSCTRTHDGDFAQTDNGKQARLDESINMNRACTSELTQLLDHVKEGDVDDVLDRLTEITIHQVSVSIFKQHLCLCVYSKETA